MATLCGSQGWSFTFKSYISFYLLKKKILEEIPSNISFTFCARQREELEVEGAVQGHGEALLHAGRLPV